MKAKLLATGLLITYCILGGMLAACTPVNHSSFVNVVSDHRQVTSETVDSLIKSIEADIAEKNYDEEQLKISNDLIERLKFIKRGSVAIENYVMSQADQETLAKLIKDRISLNAKNN